MATVRHLDFQKFQILGLAADWVEKAPSYQNRQHSQTIAEISHLRFFQTAVICHLCFFSPLGMPSALYILPSLFSLFFNGWPRANRSHVLLNRSSPKFQGW